VILRCTRKLLVIIGSPVADPAPARDPEDWYANLLWFDRRKCLLLTHAATLFTIFEADVTASSLRATRQLVTGLIGRELRREDLPAATFGDLEQQEVLLAKTADRSVLGCMNDMAFRCEHVIAEAQGLAGTDLDELNRSLRRNINSARGYRPPIELTAGRLALLRSRHLGQDGRGAAGPRSCRCSDALDSQLRTGCFGHLPEASWRWLRAWPG
jgi:Domain of unknown function (DUF6933)